MRATQDGESTEYPPAHLIDLRSEKTHLTDSYLPDLQDILPNQDRISVAMQALARIGNAARAGRVSYSGLLHHDELPDELPDENLLSHAKSIAG